MLIPTDMEKCNSTYDLLSYYCSMGEVEIRFFQKYSSQLSVEFSFGNELLQEKLYPTIWLWFTTGEGEIPWSDVTLVFSLSDGELNFDFIDCEIDEEYFPHWDGEVDEYLLDVEKLKDSREFWI